MYVISNVLAVLVMLSAPPCSKADYGESRHDAMALSRLRVATTTEARAHEFGSWLPAKKKKNSDFPGPVEA